MSYPVLCTADFGEHNSGLTVYGKLFDATGAQTGSTITTGIAEPLNGLYLYTLSAPDEHVGVFVLYDSANTALRRTVSIAPRETENADVKSSTLATPTNVSDAQTVIVDAIGDIPALNTDDIADAVLSRSASNVEDTAGIHTIAGLILAQFESSAPGTTWTIKKTDGTTTFATRTLTEDATAKPVTGVS